uniref:shikimate kinase n=1 Tax=Attheya septentrionalis TaxID=420275 RepID=A0A7S2U848_9STRA|mmetsp:Transcript_14584/g.26451  ORF Transcript_14584/g.26451 Transcript_14584/m.26451 type:complete len:296 (+) Transcript_14584:195-1082(+)
MTFASMNNSILAVSLLVAAVSHGVGAFSTTQPSFAVAPARTTGYFGASSTESVFALNAGGFEWEDPVEAADPHVENPYLNKELGTDAEGLKADPARLLAPRLQGTNIYFIGMMGSGKSAVGDVVARRMGSYNFLDTDEIIEKATSMSIPSIFEAEGEEGFRSIEAQVLDSVHAYVRCVISTGGGAVCRLSNWSKFQTGIVIWLDVDPDTLISRMQGTDRPLLQTENPLETLETLLEERTSRYSQADIQLKITPEMDANAVAEMVIKELHFFIDENPPAWKQAKAKAQAEGLDWVQ